MAEVLEWSQSLRRKKTKFSDYDLGNIDWLISMVTENCWTNPAEYPSIKQQNAILREALDSIVTLDTANPFVAPCMALLAQQALQRAGGSDA